MFVCKGVQKLFNSLQLKKHERTEKEYGPKREKTGKEYGCFPFV